MKRATIKDIGILVGVNPSTVSRALRDHQDISAELKIKIKEIAAHLKYVPNDNAVTLRNKKSKLIGLILPSIGMYFTPSVIEGISKKLQTVGYRLMVLCSQENIEQEIENIKICCNSGVDGILISVTNQTKDLEHLQQAYELEIPIVLFDKTVKQDLFDEVLIDDKKAADLCAQFLIKENCKNILAVYGNKYMTITKEREAAFEACLTQKKIKVVKTIYANSSQEAQMLTTQFLVQNKKTDGVFAMSDEVMTGVQATIQQLANKNCKLVAISDGQLPAFFNPPIPFLKHDGFALGEKAASILLQHVTDTNQNINSKKYFIDINMVEY